MKRKSPSSSCSSSSSSCCIESPLIASNNGPESKPEITKPKPKPKRVRAKKNQSDNSATSEVQVEEVHVKQETNSTPPDEVQADEAAAAHEDPLLQVVEASPPPKQEPKDSNESEGGGIVVMEPIEEHDHPWDLCLDTLFNILPIPDMPLGKASEVFDYKGFDDDIESIFDEPLDDNDILQYGCQIDADALVAEGMKGQDASNSPSSSPLSSTASACSNI